jgi:hypothetical protein
VTGPNDPRRPDQTRGLLDNSRSPGLGSAHQVEASNPDLFHAIDNQPVLWTGSDACDGPPASAADRDYASGLVSGLVISGRVTDSAAWVAGRAVYLDVQPASGLQPGGSGEAATSAAAGTRVTGWVATCRR